MLSLPDFKEKKVLFVFANKEKEVNNLKFLNENIRLYRNDEFIDQVSCFSIFSVFIVGEITLTTVLIRKLSEYGISIFLLNSSLKPYACFNSKADGNYKLREIQYICSEERQLLIAQNIVSCKLDNQYQLIKDSFDRLSFISIQKQVNNATNQDSLRGLEGLFASRYFKLIFKDLGWQRRAPQTKEDIPNLLLDIGYTFLFNFVDSILLLFGFDTYKGFYHQLFFQRKSLSCDLIEPLRPIIDKKLVKAFHLNQINERDFKFSNGKFKIIDWEKQRKYCDLFSQEIMDNKEKIYKYIANFYYYISKPEIHSFSGYNL